MCYRFLRIVLCSSPARRGRGRAATPTTEIAGVVPLALKLSRVVAGQVQHKRLDRAPHRAGAVQDGFRAAVSKGAAERRAAQVAGDLVVHACERERGAGWMSGK